MIEYDTSASYNLPRMLVGMIFICDSRKCFRTDKQYYFGFMYGTMVIVLDFLLTYLFHLVMQGGTSAGGAMDHDIYEGWELPIGQMREMCTTNVQCV